jgi:hypothetical protein
MARETRSGSKAGQTENRRKRREAKPPEFFKEINTGNLAIP